jgi:predicted dehydrogenase
MERDLRVGLVGAGWISESHAASLAAIGGARLVAVADPRKERAADVAEAAGASVHDSWEGLLARERLDAVIVCTPPALHRGPAVAALERGIPVYLEKPIARSADDARAIADAAHRSGVPCAVGYQYRALSFLPDLRELLGETPLGLLAARGIGATTSRPWFLDRAQGGGQLLERASHHVDLERALAGEVAWVQAAGGEAHIAGDRPAEADIEDVVSVTLGFRSGALGSVLVAWTRRSVPSTYDLDLVAGDARVQLDLDPGFTAVAASAGREVRLVAAEAPIRRGLRAFLDAVHEGDPGRVCCTVDDAAQTLDVILAAEEALASGTTVRLSG